MSALYPPKMLRLLYYCFYKAALTKNNSTPKLSSSITMAFTHGIQFLFLIDVMRLFFDVDIWTAMSNANGKIIFGVSALALLFIVDRFYTYKNRHLKYILEFEESINRKKRTKLIVVYLFISAAMLLLSFYILEHFNTKSIAVLV